MLNRAALLATMIAGAGLTAAVLLGQSGAVAAETAQAEPVAAVETTAAGWHLLYEGDRAKLAYGVANSDQIVVMMSCAAGDETVDVFGLAAPEADQVTLTSASMRSPIAVAPTFDPISGSMAVETSLPMGADALEGFRESGRLTLAADTGEATAVHADADELASVRDFFDHCDRRSI